MGSKHSSMHKSEYRNGKSTGYRYNTSGGRYKTPREIRKNKRGCSSIYKPGYRYDNMAGCYKKK